MSYIHFLSLKSLMNVFLDIMWQFMSMIIFEYWWQKKSGLQTSLQWYWWQRLCSPRQYLLTWILVLSNTHSACIQWNALSVVYKTLSTVFPFAVFRLIRLFVKVMIKVLWQHDNEILVDDNRQDRGEPRPTSDFHIPRPFRMYLA